MASSRDGRLIGKTAIVTGAGVALFPAAAAWLNFAHAKLASNET
jgi:hypothetical protein